MNTSLQDPALTVVLIASGRYAVIERTVNHLVRQTVADRIELLLLGPSTVAFRPPRTICERFHSVRIESVPEERRVGALRALGIELASAPYVAMAEDHCYMNALWAERLLEQHAAGAAIVGPRMLNANPSSTVSWVAHLVGYAPWTEIEQVCEQSFLPGHNSSYDREKALSVGEKLRDLMSSEVLLHWELAAAGHRLVCDPAAVCRHVNVTKPEVLRSTMYHHARNFGWLRGQSVPLWKRAAYLALSPAIPVLRFARSVGALRRGVPKELSQLRAALQLSRVLCASALGEAMGLAFGPGRSPWSDWEKELDRGDFLGPEDWYLVSGATPAGDADPPPPQPLEAPLRVGLLGAGVLVRDVLLPCLSRISEVEVIAFADPSEAARSEVARRLPSARQYEGAEALLDDDEVQAVLVAAPTGTHADLASAALTAGQHVYLEKPVAVELAEAERLLEQWHGTQLVCSVGFNYRQREDYREARRRLGFGDVGDVRCVEVRFSTAQRADAGWRSATQPGGGVLLDLASHEFDLVHWLLGEPICRVRTSRAGRGDADRGETLSVDAQTVSGVLVRGFFSSETVDDAGLRIVGSMGTIAIDRYESTVATFRGRDPRGPLGRTLQQVRDALRLRGLVERRRSPWNEASFETALRRFVDGARHGHGLDPDLADGVASLRVVDAARRSLLTGEWVETAPEDSLD
ncbi:MAG: Gfo/Idh/MocA family oxidoreductase [Acidobacteriota bacterium]